MLVDSPAAEAMIRAEQLSVLGHATKPVDFAGLATVVENLNEMGFEIRRKP